MRHWTRWTPEEDALLVELYPDRTIPMKVLVSRFGRSDKGIQARAKRLKLKGPGCGSRYKLTEDELICLHCEVPLTEENWSIAQRRKRYRICTPCNREKARKWYEEHPERKIAYRLKHREKRLFRDRQTRLSSGTKFWNNLNKRLYPEDNKCELCGKVRKRLGYHHWDDERPSLGLWLGIRCHNFAEILDKGMLPLYKLLRIKAEKELYG